jgi:hypothetical protein
MDALDQLLVVARGEFPSLANDPQNASLIMAQIEMVKRVDYSLDSIRQAVAALKAELIWEDQNGSTN